jgi:hypothetical protein
LIVTGLRVAFGFTPYWNLGLSLVMGTFTMAYGAIWGIGGFNPRMSEHPDDSKPQPTYEEMAEESGWRGMLSSTTWQLTAVTLVLIFGLIALALIPGFGLNITHVADASVKGFGTVEISVFGDTFPVNQAVLLIGFVLFTMLSLAVAGAVISGIFYALSRGVENAHNTPEFEPGQPRENVNPLMRGAGRVAGRLADAIAPPEDKQTTAVVAQEEKQS